MCAHNACGHGIGYQAARTPIVAFNLPQAGWNSSYSVQLSE